MAANPAGALDWDVRTFVHCALLMISSIVSVSQHCVLQCNQFSALVRVDDY